jgi:tRNA-uridine 2-sulfurtransferase
MPPMIAGHSDGKVWVAMSGGVDSAVAALLLKKQGYDVTGVYMKNWSDPLADECPWQEDIKDFHAVCKKIGIPARLEIFEKQYRARVVQYLINGYKKGITPNPDMLCNREIKFKLFLTKAISAGADYIATGHYVIKKKHHGEFSLWQARDNNKDQSYFLALLNQRQIYHSLFPIGQYTKPQVRAIAKKAGLPVYNKKDSQGICFIGKVKFKDFIRDFIPRKPGPIKTTKGEMIGTHDGLAFYTIGQRHGLGVGGGTPYFVVSKDKKTNSLIVSKGSRGASLFSKKLTATNFSWIANKPPHLPLGCQARIRYRQPLRTCTVKQTKNNLRITFRQPERAITPGQFVVLYKKSQMLGGGVIAE